MGKKYIMTKLGKVSPDEELIILEEYKLEEIVEEKNLSDFEQVLKWENDGYEPKETLEEKFLNWFCQLNFKDLTIMECNKNNSKALAKIAEQYNEEINAKEYQDGFKDGQVGMVDFDKVLEIFDSIAMKATHVKQIRKALENMEKGK